MVASSEDLVSFSSSFFCPSFLYFFLWSTNLQKQSELLLNADDLDAMWVCLRENCVIDDATGAEKVICIFPSKEQILFIKTKTKGY